MFCSIIINRATNKAIDKPFTYILPEHLNALVGSRVMVPFGPLNKLTIGYLINIVSDEQITNIDFKIKTVIEVLDEEPILNQEQLEMVKFLVEYYGSSYAAAISTLLPPIDKHDIKTAVATTEFLYKAADDQAILQYLHKISHSKTFANQSKILNFLLQNDGQIVSELKNTLELNTNSSINSLLKLKLIKRVFWQVRVQHMPICYDKFLPLNSEQQQAYDQISSCSDHNTFLLEGVTGSGKTEVFLHLIRDAVERGESVIVLVPEIALTRQTVNRFTERFGSRVALTHSKLTPRKRREIYLQAKIQNVQIVIGPRSAVFMPLPRLSLIIIDEEHDGSYKSDMVPKFNAIEIAIERMKHHQGKLILASATPSLESYYQATLGIYEYLKLNQRAKNATMPTISIVDMREELAAGNTKILSRRLHNAIVDTVTQGKQVMILLNRRGHSTFISCRSCGYVAKCAYCDQPFTYHQKNKLLICHHCLNQIQVPTTCPECGSKYMQFFGNGTQKIEEYLMMHFSHYGIARMDLDTVSKKNELETLLQDFEKGATKLLVGTQMISKGHDFSNVTLVGIISADSLLYIPDFRAAEKTYQLITQTLGRSGRGADQGKVIIQTHSPQNDVLKNIQNGSQPQFYKSELITRKIMGYPPYNHLFSVMISSEDEQSVIQNIKKLFAYYTHYNKKKLFRLLGPTAATMPKLANKFRWKIMIIGQPRDILLFYGRYCIDKFNEYEKPKKINIIWDIDPRNMI